MTTFRPHLLAMILFGVVLLVPTVVFVVLHFLGDTEERRENGSKP
jgi:hypothetical protein